MVVKSLHPQETKCEKCKSKGWNRPSGQSVAHPFNNLAQEIGSRHICKQATLWDPVDDLSGLPELAQHAVTVDVDPHPQNKEEDTDAKPHVCVPLLRVFRAINQVVGLQESVPYAEGSGFQKDHR